jgi:cytochrome c5
MCVAAVAGPATAADGKAVYDQYCMACHAQGVAGAPKFGSAEAWKDRIAKGKETLYEHAINGFQGESGVMPPKGGFANLSDEQVKAGVDYMVENAQ